VLERLASAGRRFRLKVRSDPAKPVTGVGLWATDGRWSDGGTLFVAGREGYAELVFSVRATTGAVSACLARRFASPALVGLGLLVLLIHALVFVLFNGLIGRERPLPR